MTCLSLFNIFFMCGCFVVGNLFSLQRDNIFGSYNFHIAGELLVMLVEYVEEQSATLVN